MKKLMFGLVIWMLFASSVVMAQQDEQTTHIVQPGENLFRIALRYGVSMDTLAQANGIVNQARIYVGQSLVIPGLSPVVENDTVANPLIASTPVVHIVQPGESLNIIARQYNTTIEQILQANNIANPNLIYRGQELNIWTAETVTQVIDEALAEEPAPLVEEVALPVEAITHEVQLGEHLSQIARRYGISWVTLAEVNGIANADTVYAGQVLTIPAVNADGGVVDMGIITPYFGNAPQPTITTGKQIIVDLSDSRIYAYENGQLVRNVVVSTGLPATPTVQGEFRIYHRLEAQTMSGPGYSLPNVQWVQYFFQGYAIHGTYWHSNFGQPMSHGCVNLPNDEALWFYEFGEIGTPVLVQT